MRFLITNYFFVCANLYLYVTPAPRQIQNDSLKVGYCKDFADFFKTGFRCDLTGAFLSSDKPNHSKNYISKGIVTPNPITGDAIPQKDINFKQILESNDELHEPGGNLAQQREMEILGLDADEYDELLGPNNHWPDFDYQAPDVDINVVATTESIDGSILANIACVIV
ncbi:hypothetical protein BB561_001703 [Smittium simulii]|uniref:Uncharacterized protein n=1 Tax=Smittium simulii TaxID=133385 RepID=A0A2T9YTE3_9FUNG|nr:hypothetical protein BB561_001703 [Smittium simulii]